MIDPPKSSIFSTFFNQPDRHGWNQHQSGRAPCEIGMARDQQHARRVRYRAGQPARRVARLAAILALRERG